MKVLLYLSLKKRDWSKSDYLLLFSSFRMKLTAVGVCMLCAVISNVHRVALQPMTPRITAAGENLQSGLEDLQRQVGDLQATAARLDITKSRPFGEQVFTSIQQVREKMQLLWQQLAKERASTSLETQERGEGTSSSFSLAADDRWESNSLISGQSEHSTCHTLLRNVITCTFIESSSLYYSQCLHDSVNSKIISSIKELVICEMDLESYLDFWLTFSVHHIEGFKQILKTSLLVTSDLKLMARPENPITGDHEIEPPTRKMSRSLDLARQKLVDRIGLDVDRVAHSYGIRHASQTMKHNSLLQIQSKW